MRYLTMAMALVALSACDLLTKPTGDEPVVLPTAHVRVCLVNDPSVVQYDCRGDGYWGNEKAPPRNLAAIPISNIPVRICHWDDLLVCRDGTDTSVHVQVQTTDSDGYAAFPGLGEDTYVFYSNITERVVQDGETARRLGLVGCTIVPLDEYGGVR